jgi:hypothetical protein
MPSSFVNDSTHQVDGPVLQSPETYYTTLNDSIAGGANPTTILIMAAVVAVFIIFSAYLGSAAPQQQPAYAKTLDSSTSLIEVVGWGLLLFLVAINGLQYVFDVDIATSITKLFKPVPEIDIVLSPADAPLLQQQQGEDQSIAEIMKAKQVFHIPNNTYTYKNAQALCQAYDARLASYDEVADAYKNGGEWCSYGWSEDQLALYPTQKSTYDVLQEIDGHQHDCGRTGINGGYIANPNVRFGVNCYGHKPVITPKEQSAMNSQSVYPLTHEQMVLDKKSAKYRAKLAKIQVSPFNGSQWSRF